MQNRVSLSGLELADVLQTLRAKHNRVPAGDNVVLHKLPHVGCPFIEPVHHTFIIGTVMAVRRVLMSGGEGYSIVHQAKGMPRFMNDSGLLDIFGSGIAVAV